MKTITKEELIDKILSEINLVENFYNTRFNEERIKTLSPLYIALSNLIKD